MRIGFVDLGPMRHSAPKHIRDKGGYPLIVLDHRKREPSENLLRRGVRKAKSFAKLADASDVIVLCLPSSVEVGAAFRAPDGPLAKERPGMISIDATTADPVVTRMLGAELAAKGAAIFDAPLECTPKEAEEGRLATHVGGDPTASLTKNSLGRGRPQTKHKRS